MSEKRMSLKDSLLWTVVAFLVLGPLVLKSFVFEDMKYSLWTLIWPACFIGAIILALFTEHASVFKNYLLSVRTELFRVTWPTRQEALQTWVVVLVVLFVMVLVIAGMDWLSDKVISLVLN
ncbi:MAG: preprotein translocase subunit SecE [Candidatus Comchoanobacterales bacterium]